jgi:hypothetical protein
MGRPSTFADEIFNQICDRLADGQTLSQICRDPEMPDRETVKRWTRNDDGRRRKYDMARQDGMGRDEARSTRARAGVNN